MNFADSEKINMILISAGLRKVTDPVKADIIIMNTCSVRQKGEDRVFGFMNEAVRYHKKQEEENLHRKPLSADQDTEIQDTDSICHARFPLFGITGCMVRKTGIAKRYFSVNSLQRADFSTHASWVHDESQGYKRKWAKKITLLDTWDTLANYDDELFLRSSRIDFTFRIEEVSFLTKILSLILWEEVGNDAKFNKYLHVKQLQENPASANIIIQTGCDNYCTYCIVPYTRGHEISRPSEDIIDEITEGVKNGTKEVTLLGQNVNSYGKETQAKLWNSEEMKWLSYASSTSWKTPFRQLLEQINTIPWLDRIRFTSSNPHDMTRDILDAHFDLPKMCNSLHFALQSGSNTVLKRMNRKHTYEDFLSQLTYLRSRDPLFSISTDIIVGFPGETEQEFEATAHALRECQFDFAYIARYSPRSGTRAQEHYTDDITPREKARRWNILNTLLQESVQTRAEMMIWRKEEILISGKGKFDGWVWRTRNFKEVYIPIQSPVKIGEIIRVEITKLDGWVLQGIVC